MIVDCAIHTIGTSDVKGSLHSQGQALGGGVGHREVDMGVGDDHAL